jgi:hypothetical protein
MWQQCGCLGALGCFQAVSLNKERIQNVAPFFRFFEFFTPA